MHYTVIRKSIKYNNKFKLFLFANNIINKILLKLNLFNMFFTYYLDRL